MSIVVSARRSRRSELQALSTRNYYDLDAGAFPPLRSIECLSLPWLRRDDATRLKKELAGAGYRRILFTRTDAWIAENGDNPLRDWGDDGPALARGAQKAWRAAKTAERSQPERVLQDLLDELNKLNARHDLETHHREQAWEAFLMLAAELGVSARQAKKIFDRREF